MRMRRVWVFAMAIFVMLAAIPISVFADYDTFVTGLRGFALSEGDSNGLGRSATVAEFKTMVEVEFDHATTLISGVEEEVVLVMSMSTTGGNNVTVPLKEVEFVLEIPSGMEFIRMSTVKDFTFQYDTSQRLGYSQQVSITWPAEDETNLAPGDVRGEDLIFRVKTPNGITADSLDMDVLATVRYQDEDCFEDIKLPFVTQTEVFGWKTPVATSAARQDNANWVAVSTDTNQSKTTMSVGEADRSKGFPLIFYYTIGNDKFGESENSAFTEDVTFTTTFALEDVVIPDMADEAKVILTDRSGDTVGTGYLTKNNDNQFTISHTKSSLTGSDMEEVRMQVAIPGVYLADDKDTGTITVKGSGEATPVVATSERPDRQSQALAMNDYVITLKSEAIKPDDPDASLSGVKKSVTKVRTTNINNDNTHNVAPFDAVTYRLGGYLPAALNDVVETLTVTDTIQDWGGGEYPMYPVSLTAGKFRNSSTEATYLKIVVSDANGNSQDIIPTSTGTVSLTNLGTIKAEDIVKIEYIYTNLPAGTTFTAANYPTVTFRINYMGYSEGTLIKNHMDVKMKYLDKEYTGTHLNDKINYVYNPEKIEGKKSFTDINGKTEAEVYYEGEELIFTLSVTNHSNSNLGRIRFVDVHSKGLELVSTADQFTYTITNPDGQTATVDRVELINPILDFEADIINNTQLDYDVPDWYDPATCSAFEFNIHLDEDAPVRPGATITITYKMKISDVAQDGDELKNRFDAWGYPIGNGTEIIYLGGGEGKVVVNKNARPVLEATDNYWLVDSPGAVSGTQIAENDPIKQGEILRVAATVKNVEQAKDTRDLTVVGFVVQISNTGLLRWLNEGTDLGSYVTLASDPTASVDWDNIEVAGNFAYIPLEAPVALKPDETLTVTYHLLALEDDTKTSAQPLQVITYPLLAEELGTYSSVLLAVHKTPAPGSNVLSQISAAANTYVSLTRNLSWQPAPVVQGHVTLSVVHQTDSVDDVLERTYTMEIRNLSAAGIDMVLDHVAAQLPLYEELVPNSVTIQFGNTTAGVTTANATGWALPDNRQILNFTFGTNNAKDLTIGANPASTGGIADTYSYARITFRTTIDGANLAAAQQYLVSRNLTITGAGEADFRATAAIYPSGSIINTEGSATTAESDQNDWNKNGDTDELRYVATATVRNQLTGLIYPGITIEPKEVKVDLNTDERYLADIQDSGTAMSPGSHVGYVVTAHNGTGAKMTDPRVSVALAPGMKLIPETGGNIVYMDALGSTSEIPVTITTDATGRQVLTWTHSGDIAASSTQTYIFTVDASDCNYGRHTVTAYLIPNEVFLETSVKPGYFDEMDLAELGLAGESRRLAWNTCSVNLVGPYRFTSEIKVDHNPAGSAASYDLVPTVTVDRAHDGDFNNDFTYTLTLNNESRAGNEKIYEKLTLINRLPGSGDLTHVTHSPRRSTDAMVMTGDVNVSIVNVGNLDEGSDYIIEYTTVPYDYQFQKSDFNQDGSGTIWSPSYSEDVTAFRITLSEKIDLKRNQTLEVTYGARFKETPAELRDAHHAILTRNSFGFGFTSSTTGSGSIDITAEPDPVGVALTSVYRANIEGKIFVDADRDGWMNNGEALYEDTLTIYLLDENDNPVTQTGAGGNMTNPVITTDGEYAFPDVPLGQEYRVTFALPDEYELTKYIDATIDDVYNVFIPGGVDQDEDPVTHAIPIPAMEEMTEDITVKRNGGIYPNYRVGQVAGEIFIDPDDSGVRTDEIYYGDVTITLYNADGPVDSQTANGDFLFTDVRVGDGYYLEISDIPAGYRLSSKIVPTTGNRFDSTDNNHTDAFEVPQNIVVRRNAGLVPQGRIYGVVYLDANENGRYDSGETIYQGALDVTLTNRNNPLWNRAATITDGRYDFPNLDYGYYSVTIQVPSGYEVSPGETVFTQTPFTSTTVNDVVLTYTNPEAERNLGLVEEVNLPDHGVVEGTVFIDRNDNQSYDAGTDDLYTASTVIVNLVDSTGIIVATQSINNAHYRFDPVPFGSYTVRISQVPDYQLTGRGAGEQGNKFNPDYQTDAFALTAQDPYRRLNAGLVEDDDPAPEPDVASIGGIIFIDGNGNSIYDTGESVYARVPVYLLDNSGQILRTVLSGTDGGYLFSNLQAGTYTVRIDIPAGYKIVSAMPDHYQGNKFTATGVTLSIQAEVGNYYHRNAGLVAVDGGGDNGGGGNPGGGGGGSTIGGGGGGGGGTSRTYETGSGWGSTVTIEDDGVPLGNLPDLVTILDDDIPLGNLPQTGGSGLHHLMGLMGIALLTAGLAGKKRRKDR